MGRRKKRQPQRDERGEGITRRRVVEYLTIGSAGVTILGYIERHTEGFWHGQPNIVTSTTATTCATTPATCTTFATCTSMIGVASLVASSVIGTPTVIMVRTT